MAGHCDRHDEASPAVGEVEVAIRPGLARNQRTRVNEKDSADNGGASSQASSWTCARSRISPTWRPTSLPTPRRTPATSRLGSAARRDRDMQCRASSTSSADQPARDASREPRVRHARWHSHKSNPSLPFARSALQSSSADLLARAYGVAPVRFFALAAMPGSLLSWARFLLARPRGRPFGAPR